MSEENIVEHTITLHRSRPIPGGRGARIGYSDDYPDRQFLIVPEHGSTPLSEQLEKLYKIANSALRTNEQRRTADHPNRSTVWWDGYRQCLDDLAHFAHENGLGEVRRR